MIENKPSVWWEALVARFPAPFREGNRPYVLGVALVLLLLMLLSVTHNPYPNAHWAPILFAGLIVGGLVAIRLRAPEAGVLHVVGAGGWLILAHAAWFGGGVYSPRLAWLALLPMAPFYLIGLRSAWAWLMAALTLLTLSALATWMGWLGAPVNWDSGATDPSSAVTHSLVLLCLVMVPVIHDNSFRRQRQELQRRNEELREQSRALEAADRERSAFIASVSHELRTPMNAIIGFNDLLLQRTLPPAAEPILRVTRQSADHLLTVINDVLDHSQLQAGHLRIAPERIDLPEAIRQGFELLRVRAENQGLDYRLQIAPDIPQWVQADPHRLNQVLVNLLGNAVKFTPQGSVRLQVRRDGARLQFEVHDTGIGIPQAQQGQIFERFYQADQPMRNGGTGLGLSISAQLVKLMGGEIGFESEAARGSRFWFWLPLVSAEAPRVSEAQPSADAPVTLGAARILVVDDQPINRMLVCQILRHADAQVQCVQVENGAQALAALREAPFDLVIMDMVMPEMDGLEATRRLRQEFPAPQCHTPVLGLTANVVPQDLQKFSAAGANLLALKPFVRERLLAQIARLLHPPRT